MVDRGKIEKTGAKKFDKMPSETVATFSPQCLISCSFNCSFKETTNLLWRKPASILRSDHFLSAKTRLNLFFFYSFCSSQISGIKAPLRLSSVGLDTGNYARFC